MVKFVCSWCGELVDPVVAIEDVDSGTVLTCRACEGDTILSLATPKEKADQLSGLALLAMFPKYALGVILEGKEASHPAIFDRALAKLKGWLDDTQSAG